ncbi:MAG: putative rane protein ArfC [Mycobacterium sp.]|jgi:uncharacterized membrane protein ArfC|nr:putative rane protein ArfC [Mycobacterium sp.]
MTVNWWFVALAFVLGLVITAAFMIRRVEREAPVSAEAGAAGGGSAAKLVDSGSDTPPADKATETTAPVEEPPYGEGSLRLAVASADAPSGYTIKGNEDSMLYHSAESPTYKRTVAEVWFRDVETAEAAGFNRWDSGKSQRGK